MKRMVSNISISFPFILAWSMLTLMGCSTTNTRSEAVNLSCDLSHKQNLELAIKQVQESLDHGCETHFDQYLEQLLTLAEGDPKPENKAHFSEFLLKTSDDGLLSRRQAQMLYNRYFNVKYVAMMGDYNNCSYTCPNKKEVLSRMEKELSDKERGLLKISLDKQGYYRADSLLKETELVLEATCTACGSLR